MKRTGLFLSLLIIATPALADSSDVITSSLAKPPVPLFETRTPLNGADLYPGKARNDEIDGVAIVICSVKPDGTLTGCHCYDEAPKGYGFCRATVRLIERDAAIDIAGYGLSKGSKVAIQHKWRLT